MFKIQGLVFFLSSVAVLCLSCQSDPSPERWDLSDFVKVDSLNPILSPDSNPEFNCPLRMENVSWEERNVLNPSAVVKDGKVHLFYRAQDAMGTSRIGLAISEDGLNFRKHPKPVFYPDRDSMYDYEWNYRKREMKGPPEDCKSCYFDGVEDPRIIEDESGTYWMTYTAYDGDKARLSLASSKDLMTWTKHGLVLKEEQYRNLWSKSGAIIGQLKNERIVATRIAGSYWMYFGDTDLFIARSDDLLNWQPATDEEKGELIRVMHPRKGYFDSRLVEPGPFALKTEKGILLIYNGSNAANYQYEGYPKYTYAAGQALFDSEEPFKMIDRTSEDFLHPEKDYEKVGEVNEVCFVEGLVFFKGKWFLYYGTGDSKIAVAISNQGPL
jgi:predicted GH43/DUF377 family glycosyl hydrolase